MLGLWGLFGAGEFNCEIYIIINYENERSCGN